MVKKKSILVVIILLCLVLQLYTINKSSFWFDEVASSIDAREPLKKILFDPNWKDQVPLYRVVLHIWIKLFGEDELTLRLFSVMFGIITILMTYKLAKVMFNIKTGLIASFLMSINLFFISHAQEARKYTLFIAISLCTLLLVFRILNPENKHRRKDWIMFTLFSILNLYIHLFSLFLLISEIIFLALNINKKELKSLIASCIIIPLLFLPIVLKIFLSISFREEFHPDLGIAVSVFDYLKSIFFGFSGSQFLFVVFFLLIIVSISSLHKNKRKLLAFFLIITTLPLIIVYLLKNIIMDIQVRHFIFLLPIIMIYVAYGITRLKNKVLISSSLALIIILSLMPLNNYYNRQRLEWDTATQYIESNFIDEDIILVSWWTKDIIRYYTDLPYKPIEERLNQHAKRVWVLYRDRYPTSYETKELINKLRNEVLMDKKFGDINVYLISNP